LDLNNVTLVGFSMGGGEIALLNTGGTMSAVPPFLLKTDNNPEGVATPSGLWWAGGGWINMQAWAALGTVGGWT
jgi:hypothetical protein